MVSPDDAGGMANSVNSIKRVPLRAVSSRSALLAHADLFQYLEFLRYARFVHPPICSMTCQTIKGKIYAKYLQ